MAVLSGKVPNYIPPDLRDERRVGADLLLMGCKANSRAFCATRRGRFIHEACRAAPFRMAMADRFQRVGVITPREKKLGVEPEEIG